MDSPAIDFDVVYTYKGIANVESFSIELITRWVWSGPDGGELR